MGPFEESRNKMVDAQLVGRGIKDTRVLEAFRKVPRHLFVRESIQRDSYGDFPLPIGCGQTISQPYMVALMTECLNLKGNEKVLEVGTGSGYQAAILAELSKEVYSAERHKELADNAGNILDQLGYTNIHIYNIDGTQGFKGNAPYDRIIVTAGAPHAPKPLKEQLAEGGILVIPIGDRFSQVLTIVKRIGNTFTEKVECGCMFVPLVGKYGWEEKES